MKLGFFACALLVTAAACSSGGTAVCPSGWSDLASAPGGCQAPDAFPMGVTSGVYGFVRTNAHDGKQQLVVGSLVFAVPGTSTTCDAPSVDAVAQTTTDDQGVYTMMLPAGDYRITSGEVPSCLPVHIDATSLTEIALTSP